MISWSRTDLIDILEPPFTNRQNCSHIRTAKHVKISCLPQEKSLNHSWPSWMTWILPQVIRDIHLSPPLSCPWFLAELCYCSKSIDISTTIHNHPGMPRYKKHNRLRMSSVLHPPQIFAFFSLLLEVSIWKWVLASELEGNTDNTRNLKQGLV